jgi:DNA-3-methyladenine glycosylase II
MKKIKLLTPPDYRWSPNIAYLSRSANECLFRVDAGTVTRCVPLGVRRPIVTIGENPDGHLDVSVREIGADELTAVQDELIAYVTEWLDLRRDLTPFYAMAANDPHLAGPVAAFRGLHLAGVPDLFEALAWAIIGQQINLTFAYTLKRRLVEAFGDYALDHEGGRHWIFPTPEKVASLRYEELTALQMTRKKAEYLVDTAALIANGSLSKDGLLQTGGLAEVERQLLGIRGIGPWTAHYAAMRCLRFPDAFPIQDVGLHLAIQRQLGMDRKPSLAEIRSLAAGWAGWESYAVFYLWRTLY